MHLYRKVIEYQGDPTFTIWPLGDTHKGTIHHNSKVWKQDLATVTEDPHALWLGMGDACECIVMSDPRFMPSEIAEEFLPHLGTLAIAQRDSYLRDVAPIANKCIGVLEGNHCFEFRRRNYVDIAHDIARELGAEYLGDTAFVKLVFRRMDEDGERLKSRNLMLYVEHGACGGVTMGAVVNYLERLMNSFDADLFLTAHTHKKAVLERPRLAMKPHGEAGLVDKHRFGVCTGAYYETYKEASTSYGQRKSYPPTALGAVPIRFRPSTGECEVII